MSDPITRLNAALEGRYRIERQLGEGGMATVYLADDLRHERKVALKVLKPELAAVVGADRFLAEIKTTANLQHPHILPLFDSGEADSFLFYVMPYVEGESLRERLDREHQLPVDEAVQIAKTMAEALDYAHRQGVIHRDIKPANILLQDRKPVVSDFGIALAVGAAGGGRLTETGLSLGTPHYMSPEQATGDLSVGLAADIYALGCVLYEMLVGEPPHTGSTAQAILGKIIQAAPVSATATRASVPANVDGAIRKALEKLPADRFTSARDFARSLEEPGFRYGGPGAAAGVGVGGGGWGRTTWAFAALFGITALALGWALFRPAPEAAPESPVISFTVPVGEGSEVYLGGQGDAAWGRPASTSIALSPDGSLLVYTAWEIGPEGEVISRLYQRRLDREEAIPLEGTRGATNPFFSPDGEWIGFGDEEGRLRRFSVSDGDVETIAQDATEVGSGFLGATWGEGGDVVYGAIGGLYRVPADGGAPELLLEADTIAGGLVRPFQPQWLPGDDVLLFQGARAGSSNPEDWEILALDVASGNRTTLLTDATDPHYVDTGQLLFMRQGTLMAVGFDPGSLEIRRAPVAVIEDVMQALAMPNGGWNTGAGQVAVSRSGHLAYVGGGVYPLGEGSVRRVGLDGAAEELGLDPAAILHLRVSHRGDRLAFSTRSATARELFVHDLDRGVTRRLNTGSSPEWSPDDTQIAFTADVEDGVNNIYRMPSDGSGQPERLAPSGQSQTMFSWSSVGAIAYGQGGDLWILPPEGEAAPFFTS